MPRALSSTFNKFFDSERSGGNLLIVCTALSLALTNSAIGPHYLKFWQSNVGGLSLEHWINDALMAVFFLLIGLELERELYTGELSGFEDALLPIVAAVGGMAAPALIHFSLNAGRPTQTGIGIPISSCCRRLGPYAASSMKSTCTASKGNSIFPSAFFRSTPAASKACTSP